MNRNNIEKIAQNLDDKILLAKIWDKINLGVQRNIPAYTGFLSLHQQQMCQYLFGNAEGLHFFGGYENAERKMLLYLPEYLTEEYFTSADSPICCLRAEFYEGDTLSHRDFLGALMGCGISRECIGDILISGNCCDFLVTATIAPYLLDNLISAGRSKLQLSQIQLSQIQMPVENFTVIRDTVASLRLDNIISAGFRMSRSAAVTLITAGKAAVDGLSCEKPDQILCPGCKISLRGFGKMHFTAINGKTKKDRISITIHRYM